MISLSEMTTWSAEDALARLKIEVPSDWTVEVDASDEGVSLVLSNSEGEQMWAGGHIEPKILFLDALGWLSTRSHAFSPAWQPRTQEVPLHRPEIQQKMDDPPDLDPEEVEAVYKSTR